MNKKIIIALVLILVFGLGGFFWWWENRETPPEKWEAAKVSPRADYVIKESPEGKTIENKKVGISFRIPKGWNLKDSPSNLPDVIFYSQNTEISEEINSLLLNVLKKGCRIHVATAYIRTTLDRFEENLKEQEIFKFKQPLTANKYERVRISNWMAIKHTFEGEELKMYFIIVYVPSESKLYEIGLLASLEDKEWCKTEFNKFLETVSIE